MNCYSILPTRADNCLTSFLNAAVDAAVAIKFLRVGSQSSICANRIFVQKAIAPQFTKAFVERIKLLKVGHGFEQDMQIGPFINKRALDKVSYLVEDSRERGVKVATGGKRLSSGNLADGYFYAPTVLLDVEDSMPICTEEIFGPVALILTFTTEIELCLVGKNELSLVRSKSVRTYAQTNIQLFNQLRLAQYSKADLNYLCNIYDFAL
jgi:acyl-CoA reductase-like NAD-dependent aldehyde dehydrogenase